MTKETANAAIGPDCPKYGGQVCVAEAGALCECYPGGLEYRKGLGIPTQAERDASAAPAQEPPESLDDYMLRMADVKAPNSIKRIAWATGKTIQEVVDDLSR